MVPITPAFAKNSPHSFLFVFSSGAFAKRDLPKDTIITGTPLLVFHNNTWFDMYDFQDCDHGVIARNSTDGPYGQQLLLNYCFAHQESTVVLCPVSKRLSACLFVFGNRSSSFLFFHLNLFHQFFKFEWFRNQYPVWVGCQLHQSQQDESEC
jgi:hypothetical protein